MQNLDVKGTIQKIKKNKPDIKKELEESITKEKKNENTDIQQKVNICLTNKEYAAKVVPDNLLTWFSNLASVSRQHCLTLL